MVFRVSVWAALLCLVAVFSQACSDDRRLLNVHLKLGEVQLQKGLYATAKQNFERAQQLAPDNEQAALGRRAALAGELAVAEEPPPGLNPEAALVDIRAAARLETSWRALFLVAAAKLLEWLDREPQAITQLREALVESPTYGAAYYELGRLLALEGNLEAAERVLRRGSRLAVYDQRLQVGYGRLLAAKKKYAEAIAVLTPLADVLDDPEPLWLLAESLRFVKRDEDAASVMAQVLNLDPKHPLALSELGLYRLRAGANRQAAALFDRYLAVAVSRSEPRARISLVSRLRRSLSTRQPISAPSKTAPRGSNR